jgi:hypothetical protein
MPRRLRGRNKQAGSVFLPNGGTPQVPSFPHHNPFNDEDERARVRNDGA